MCTCRQSLTNSPYKQQKGEDFPLDGIKEATRFDEPGREREREESKGGS